MRVALIALLLVVAPAARAEETPPPKDAPGRAEVGEAPTSFTRTQVDAAVKGGVAYLRRTQRDDGGWGPIGKDRLPVQMYRHPAGPTALALYALRTCGVPRSDPTVQRGFAHLRASDDGIPLGTYECATVLLALLAEPVERREAAAEEGPDAAALAWARRLVDALLEKKAGTGWRYGLRGAPRDAPAADLSSTHWTAYALFVAHRAGIRVPDAVWEAVLAFSLAQQDTDGPDHTMKMGRGERQARARGFAYLRGYAVPQFGTSSGGMTACGFANLAMARHVLTDTGDAERVKAWQQRPDANVVQTGLHDALAWLDSEWSPYANPRRPYEYYLFWMLAVERAMDLTGQQVVGNHLWYSEMGQQLVDRQTKDGSWDSATTYDPRGVLDTCFALLFLERAARGLVAHPRIDLPK